MYGILCSILETLYKVSYIVVRPKFASISSFLTMVKGFQKLTAEQEDILWDEYCSKPCGACALLSTCVSDCLSASSFDVLTFYQAKASCVLWY